MEKPAGQLPTYRLMIPGPGEMDDDIVTAMGRPIAAHYGADWAKLYQETLGLMQHALGTSSDVIFLFSSGQGAMEAALGSLFAPGEQILVVDNGFFAQRLMQLMEAIGLKAVPVSAAWGVPVSLDAIRSTLAANSTIKGMVAVQHETSTGMLNPIEALGAIAREFDLPFVVDAIASAGGDPLYVDAWGIDICVTVGNKCLGAPVGWAPISVSERAWALMEEKGKTAVGWYLDLKMWRNIMVEQWDWHPTPVTMSSHTLEALHLALTKLQDEGLENRWRRYRETAVWFRAAMRERGFSFFVEGEQASSVITAVKRPPNMDGKQFAETLYNDYKIQIAHGLGQLKNDIFRIGHMGKAQENALAFLAALDEMGVG